MQGSGLASLLLLAVSCVLVASTQIEDVQQSLSAPKDPFQEARDNFLSKYGLKTLYDNSDRTMQEYMDTLVFNMLFEEEDSPGSNDLGQSLTMFRKLLVNRLLTEGDDDEDCEEEVKEFILDLRLLVKEAKELLEEGAEEIKEKIEEKKKEIDERIDKAKKEIRDDIEHLNETIQEKKEEIKEQIEEEKEEFKEKVDDIRDRIEKKEEEIEEKIEEDKEEFKEKVDDIHDKIEKKKAEIKEKIEEDKEEFKEKVDDIHDKIEKKKEEIKEKIEADKEELKEELDDLDDKIKKKNEEIKEKIEEEKEKIKDKIEEDEEEFKEKVDDIHDKIEKKEEEIKEKIEEEKEDIKDKADDIHERIEKEKDEINKRVEKIKKEIKKRLQEEGEDIAKKIEELKKKLDPHSGDISAVLEDDNKGRMLRGIVDFFQAKLRAVHDKTLDPSLESSSSEDSDSSSSEEGDSKKASSFFQHLEETITYDDEKSLDDNLKAARSKIISEVEKLREELNEENPASLYKLLTDDFDPKKFLDDIVSGLSEIDVDDIKKFLEQFEPEVENIKEKWQALQAAVNKLENLVQRNHTRPDFDYDLAWQVYGAIKEVVAATEDLIDAIDELEEAVLKALIDKIKEKIDDHDVPDDSGDIDEALKTLRSGRMRLPRLMQQYEEWLKAPNHKSKPFVYDDSEPTAEKRDSIANYMDAQNTLLSSIDLKDLEKFLKELEPYFEKVNQTRQDLMQALDELDETLKSFCHADSPHGFALEVIEALENVQEKEKAWVEAIEELEEAIKDAVEDLIDDSDISFDIVSFLREMENLAPGSFKLNSAVQQYATWSSDPEKSSQPFVYSSSGSQEEDGIQLSAESGGSSGSSSGASAGEVAMIIVGCAAIATGLAMVGVVLIKKQRRRRLYTKLPSVWSNTEMVKTGYDTV